MIEIEQYKRPNDFLGEFALPPSSIDSILGNTIALNVLLDGEGIGNIYLSDDEYEYLEFGLDGRIVYLSFIKLEKKGYLRETIEALCDFLSDQYDYIVLQVEPSELKKFKTLKVKYDAIGFESIAPENQYDYDFGVHSDIDLMETDIFMYMKI